MSCRTIERLFLENASEDARRAHRASCPACEVLARDAETGENLSSGLAVPEWSSALREALLSVPALTLDCDAAADAIARSLEDGEEVSSAGRSRLDFHLSRCEGCREAHGALAGTKDFAPPAPSPWLAPRLSASKPARPRARWRRFLGPRAAIGFAYALAVVVMIAGFNPADLVHRAGSGLRNETEKTAAVAGNSLADRIGAFQDRATRQLAVWRGFAGGYGRAVLSNVIALVMKSDDSGQPPSRPRNGDGRFAPKNETAIRTWRA